MARAQPQAKKDKAKRKKQGSAAVDASLFSIGGAGGDKGAKKIKIAKSISLAAPASGKTGTINSRITLSADSFSPSARAEGRKRERSDEPQLAKGLAAIAASVAPGKSKIGAAISGGLTGAAIGATIGEAIDRGRKRKTKAKARPKKKKSKEDDE